MPYRIPWERPLASSKRPLHRVCFVVALALTSTVRADDAARDRAAEVDGDAAANARSPESHERRGIEEIVVTANRRAESIQDTVGSITAIDGRALEQAGAIGMQDFVFTVPGADFVNTGLDQRIAIRGIANLASGGGIGGGGASTSPVGLYLGDVPIQGNGVLPDLELYDLQRIEVLKGPQGTLYGEGAQGGAVKMLPEPADPSRYEAKGEVGVGHTYNGSGLNNFQHLALNAPLFGSFAVRLVGSRRIDQGFIDFPNRGARGEDDAENLMGRIHLDGEVWDGLSASGLLFHQRQRLDQLPMGQLDAGDLTNRNTEPQFVDVDFTLAAMTLDYDLGFAELTSASSWFRNDREALSRFPLMGAIVFGVVGPGLAGAIGEPPGTPEEEWIEVENHQFGVAEELRLVSSADSWLDWVAGFFFRRRENDSHILLNNSVDRDVPPPAGAGSVESSVVETFQQYASFGEANVQLPWDLKLGVGLRGFRESVHLDGQTTFHGRIFYPLALAAGRPDGSAGPRSFGTTTTAFTPKASLSWFADDLRMLYAQVAKGVRSGGGNTQALYGDVTPVFEPDHLWAYEVGAKTQWLDGLLTANLAAFYNDWQDLQVLTLETGNVGNVPTPLAVILNVARAVTRGVELELLAAPIENATLGFNAFVGDGEIIEGDPEGNIPDHTPMPQLANLSYSAHAQYAAPDWSVAGFTPSLLFDTQFTGDRTAFPPLIAFDNEVEGFQLFNALAGFSSERFELGFGVRNLTDTRPQLGTSLVENELLTFGRPRTWTARLAFRF